VTAQHPEAIEKPVLTTRSLTSHWKVKLIKGISAADMAYPGNGEPWFPCRIPTQTRRR